MATFPTDFRPAPRQDSPLRIALSVALLLAACWLAAGARAAELIAEEGVLAAMGAITVVAVDRVTIEGNSGRLELHGSGYLPAPIFLSGRPADGTPPHILSVWPASGGPEPELAGVVTLEPGAGPVYLIATDYGMLALTGAIVSVPDGTTSRVLRLRGGQ